MRATAAAVAVKKNYYVKTITEEKSKVVYFTEKSIEFSPEHQTAHNRRSGKKSDEQLTRRSRRRNTAANHTRKKRVAAAAEEKKLKRRM